MQGKTLIVTGAAGFIGANFTRLALAKGYSVVGLDSLTYAGHRESVEGLGGFELVVGDIRDSALVQRLLTRHRPQALLNFAAESHVDRSITGPAVFVETNVLGTANLLQESLAYWRGLAPAEASAFRYLQVSTDEVYGSLGDTGFFSETTPVNPSSPYSASKTAADHLVNAWHHTFKLPTITTRCSNNYGPYQFPEKLIPHMIRCALDGKPLPVYGTGTNVRDWIHVEDHCQGILLALTRGQAGGVYCLGGRSERRNIDLVQRLAQTLDRLRPRPKGGSYAEQIAFVTDRPGHDFRYAIDDSLAQNELGFTRKHSFESGLEQTIRWYLDNEEWSQRVLGGKK